MVKIPGLDVAIDGVELAAARAALRVGDEPAHDGRVERLADVGELGNVRVDRRFGRPCFEVIGLRLPLAAATP